MSSTSGLHYPRGSSQQEGGGESAGSKNGARRARSAEARRGECGHRIPEGLAASERSGLEASERSGLEASERSGLEASERSGLEASGLETERQKRGAGTVPGLMTASVSAPMGPEAGANIPLKNKEQKRKDRGTNSPHKSKGRLRKNKDYKKAKAGLVIGRV